MIEKIPEEKAGGQTIIYSPVIKQKKSGAFVDVFTLAITVVIFIAMIASYFVTVKPCLLYTSDAADDLSV